MPRFFRLENRDEEVIPKDDIFNTCDELNDFLLCDLTREECDNQGQVKSCLDVDVHQHQSKNLKSMYVIKKNTIQGNEAVLTRCNIIMMQKNYCSETETCKMEMISLFFKFDFHICRRKY